MSYGKRTPLSIETKLEVLEALKFKSKIDVSKEFGIGYSTVKKIKQKECEILGKSGSSVNLLRKRNRQSPNEEVGDALITWFHQMKKQNLPINGPIMLDKAKELALTLGYEDFRPSHGWLERLKARNNIRFQKPFAKQSACSSGGSNSKVEAGGWIENVLPKMMEGYDPKNIFNAVESALFYKVAPSILTGNHMQNGTAVKDRLTVLFLGNSTGTEKHAFAIGKISNPSCFDTEGTPLPYYSSTNALMTDFIWRDILQKLDQSLGKRKIVLFVDNVACHKIKLKLKNIKIALMPTDSSAIHQPLKIGVVRAVKIRYRSQLLKKMISASNNGVLVSDFSKSIDLLNTLRMLETAWSSISPALFVDSFQKARFYPDDVYCLEDTPDQSPEEFELKELLQEDFGEFVDCDKDVDCFESPTTDSKIDCFDIPTTNSKTDTVTRNKQETTTVDEFADIDNAELRVSHEEALDALSVVRRYLDENFTEYNAYYEVEEMVRLSAYANSTGNEMMDSFSFDC